MVSTGEGAAAGRGSAADLVWRERKLLQGLLEGAPARHGESVEELIARCADGDMDFFDLRALARVDPHTLAGAARVELVQVWERAAAMVAGAQQDALAAVVDATTAGGLDGEAARHEVGAALRLAPVTAAERTRVAANLRARHPATLAALKTGTISYRQASFLAEGVRDLPDQLARGVEDRVLPRMPDQTAAETRRAVRDTIVRIDPAGAEDRRKKAVKDRTIERLPQPDGMASWFVSMPADAEHDLWTALTARALALQTARRAAGLEVERLTPTRVDALIDLILGRTRLLPHPDPASDHTPGHTTGENVDPADATPEDQTVNPDLAALVLAILDGTATLTPDVTSRTDHASSNGGNYRGSDGGVDRSSGAGSGVGRAGYLPHCSCGGRQVAAVVLDLPTALGLADNPGHLNGYGAIPAPLARRMAADRDWIRWTRDPGTKAIIDRGAHTYRPSERLKAFIAARDRTCGFPGCNTPAQACDCDHIATYRLGGRTITINLGPLCRQHHNAKTHGRWTLGYDPETNTKTWTSPLGKTYLKNATPLLH